MRLRLPRPSIKGLTFLLSPLPIDDRNDAFDDAIDPEDDDMHDATDIDSISDDEREMDTETDRE
jgi:hypothetical protein